MTRLGLAPVLALIGACLAACSAGSSLGDPGNPPGSGAATATGGKGGTTAAGGGGGTATGGTSGSTGGSSTGGDTGTSGSSGTSGTSGTSGSSGSSGTGGSMTTSCPTSQMGSPALRLLTRREFDNTINDIFPSVKGAWTDSLPANITADSGFDNGVSNLVGNQLASALTDTAVSIATAVTGSGFQDILPCAATMKDHTCAQKFIETTGRLLFRHDISTDDETPYLALFDQGLAASDFPTAMKWVIAALIESPNTVYRSELGAPAAGGRQLRGSEIATELAYTFGGSTPSSDLITQFAGGSAPSADMLLSTAQSLLQTDNGKLAVQHFFEQYLTYTGTAGITRTLTDPAPTPYTNVASDMVAETQSFISKVILPGGSLSDLLTSNKTYPSTTLAQYYGLPAPGADGSVVRPSGQGLGVLAQGAFLSTHANSDYSSPTQRGLFVYYRLLCQAKLSPPGGKAPPVSTTEISAATTTRQLYETAHMTQDSCKGCHKQFDPIGFGFENFDQGGRFRTQQNGVNVDPSGNVVLEDGTMLFSFKDEADLVQQLAQTKEVAECFSAYMSTYAFGTTTACLGSSNAPGLHDGSLSIVQAFANLAKEPNFTQRNAQ